MPVNRISATAVSRTVSLGVFMRRRSIGHRLTPLLRLLAGVLIACVLLKPHAAYAWWDHDWTARKTITIDTSTAGADIASPIGTTPVLIRLDVGNFTFDSANPDGSDLRFVAADDKTPLAYHIEKYDNLLGQAFIWVAVPDLKSEAPTSIFLYYGNKKATAADDPKGTYDANMMAVYHFGEHGAPARDWTGNGNTAVNAGAPDDFALIAGGLRLDGQSTVQLPASPTLAWTGNNALTWSVWFNETNLQPDAVLYSRTDGTNTVQIGVNNGAPFVAIVGPGGTQRSTAGTPVAAGGWHHLAVVANGAQISLYLDGAPFGALGTGLPALNSIAYLGGDATTGSVPAVAPAASPATPAPPPAAGAASPAAAPASGAATTGFIGTIDELEISNIARPAGFIDFAAIGQGGNPLAAKLITVGAAEQPASWFSGPFAIILGAVTPDGWAIIVILMLMAISSWIVMANKVAYVNKISRANHVFIDQYARIGQDLTALVAPEREAKTLDASPLYHLYRIGADQIAIRFPGETRRARILSAQSIAAIRSSLDAGVVREMHRLNSSIVLLTIAISGGPFLGLLGTVVGVMITFATIAAAGDVNVNAIAPGISAALVATVAGLIVAIPALFGYNYLNTRIGSTRSDMLVFVDEFETRMAELYSPHPRQDPQAAE
jgi:biopolymer transport protein ExbB